MRVRFAQRHERCRSSQLQLAVRKHGPATRASTHGSAQDVQSAPVRSLPTRAVKIIKPPTCPRPARLSPNSRVHELEKIGFVDKWCLVHGAARRGRAWDEKGEIGEDEERERAW
jgi:hypothetical protein